MNIRPYNREDENSIVELLDLVFPQGPWTDLECSHLEHWKWKYADNPVNKVSVVVAEKAGTIIGTIHSMLKNIQIGNEIWISSIGADAAVHPEHRKKGIFSLMLELLKQIHHQKGISFHSSVVTNPIIMKRTDRLKTPVFPYEIIEVVKTNSPFRKTNLYHNKPVTEIINIDKFDDNINDFWNKILKTYQNISVRDKRYLNWRYCDPRGGKYHILSAVEDNKIQGYVVLRVITKKKGYPPRGGYIVDLLTLPGNEQVSRELIESSLCFFNETEIEKLYFWGLQKGKYVNMLNDYGFEKCKNISVKFLDEGYPIDITTINEIEVGNTHFCLGDHDHV